MQDQAIKQLHVPTQSNVPAILWNLFAFAAAVGSLMTGWPTDHPAWVVAVILALAYVQHCWTIIFHEDSHYLLYEARWHNRFNGTIVGTLLLIPFDIFRNVHMRHHAHMNTHEDWELWPYVDPKASLTFRRIFVFLDVFFGAWVDPYIYNRIFFVKNSPIRDPKLRRKIKIQFLIMGLFWASVLAVVAYKGWWMKLLIVYVIPVWLTGVIQATRKLIEHLGLPAGDAMAGARTILPKDWMGRIAGWTSFHIEAHGLHHAYPQMPHNHLEKALELTEHTSPDRIFPSYWRAFLDMLPHLKNPAIGRNLDAVNAMPARAVEAAPAEKPLIVPRNPVQV